MISGMRKFLFQISGMRRLSETISVKNIFNIKSNIADGTVICESKVQHPKLAIQYLKILHSHSEKCGFSSSLIYPMGNDSHHLSAKLIFSEGTRIEQGRRHILKRIAEINEILNETNRALEEESNDIFDEMVTESNNAIYFKTSMFEVGYDQATQAYFIYLSNDKDVELRELRALLAPFQELHPQTHIRTLTVSNRTRRVLYVALDSNFQVSKNFADTVEQFVESLPCFEDLPSPPRP